MILSHFVSDPVKEEREKAGKQFQDAYEASHKCHLLQAMGEYWHRDSPHKLNTGAIMK